MHYCLNIITNERIFALYVLLATFAKRFDFVFNCQLSFVINLIITCR